MSDKLASQLVAGAALAATSPRDRDAAFVRTALAWGHQAALLGRRLPLFALLDACALARSPSGGALPHPDRKASHLTRSYDNWLQDFQHLTAVRLARGSVRGVAGPPRPATITLPLLLAEWPDHAAPDGDSADFADAYAALAREEGAAERVLASWRRERPTRQEDDWKPWRPAARPKAPARNPLAGPRAAALWSRFATARGEPASPEDLDHDAARLYLSAHDPAPSREQVERLRALREAVPDPTRRPPNQTRDTLHPHVGVRTLASLVQDDESVYFNEVNGVWSKLSDEPRSDPPQTVQVHLCWVAGYDALLDPGRGAAERTAPASKLQALVALLLDDWRDALSALLRDDGAELHAGLRVRFHLHRHWPGPQASVYLGRPGPRWKARAADGPMPPEEFVAALFERLDHVRLAADLAWNCEAAPAPFEWWCGCALTCDLPALGFERHDLARPGDERPQAGWSAKGSLPACFRHLIVLDARADHGWICRVEREEGECRLRAVSSRPAAAAGRDFAGLRHDALDLLLDVLLARGQLHL